MEKNYNWNDLLVLTGFLPEEDHNGDTILRLWDSDDTNFLDRLLEKTNAEYEKDGTCYKFNTTPPKAKDWFAVFSNSDVGVESGSPFRTEDIEFPLNAPVIQLKRLGLVTTESCRGFHRRNPNGPYIKFLAWRDAITAEKLFQTGGYFCYLTPQKRLFINEGIDGILDLGLWMSKIRDIHEYRHPILMKREKRLLDLLDIPGSTGKEEQVGEHLLTILKNRLDSLWMDEYGNVLGELRIPAKKNQFPTILLSAHQDVVDNSGEGKEIIRQGNKLRRDGGILGADDRAGIAAIINTIDVLKQYQIGCHLKIAFTVHEERGQEGASAIDTSFFDGVDFAVSMDRRGETDIIYRYGEIEYCDKSETSFITRLSRYLWRENRHHFQAVEGGKSDLLVWSQRGIPSVNLSIGYFNEHHSNEYLNLDAWHRAQDLLLEIIADKSGRLPHKK